MLSSIRSVGLAAVALTVIGLAFAVATNGASAHHRSSERLVVRGVDTVKDSGGECPGGVCKIELADGAFRGTVGTGAYAGSLDLEVAKAFPNGEGGVCAPIDGHIVLGAGSPNRLVLALDGDSCQDGPGPVTEAAFTNVAEFTVKHGTGTFAKARGSGIASFSEDASDRERMTLIGRISR
jgi:hypothetical protein